MDNYYSMKKKLYIEIDNMLERHPEGISIKMLMYKLIHQFGCGEKMILKKLEMMEYLGTIEMDLELDKVKLKGYKNKEGKDNGEQNEKEADGKTDKSDGI